jgi:hypothetical protein
LTEVDWSKVRRPWREGPDPDAAGESWLALTDDDLLFRIESLPDDHGLDLRLMEVVRSDRHFFIRQEAAKRVTESSHLLGQSGDRHIGQILVRRLTRREDVAYLRKLVDESRHIEVRKAAEAQLKALLESLAAAR